MKILLATRNTNKIKEITAIFADARIQFLTLDQFPNVPEVDEDRPTLEGNAEKKATEVSKHSGVIALADDSGLEIDFLDGAPGVISARFAGPGCSYQDNNLKVLTLMKGVPSDQRKARFRSVISIAGPGINTQTVEGSLEGFITDQMRGEDGFGYDPIFLVPEHGKTLAEMGPNQKNSLSHRYKALQAIHPVLLALNEAKQL